MQYNGVSALATPAAILMGSGAQGFARIVERSNALARLAAKAVSKSKYAVAAGKGVGAGISGVLGTRNAISEARVTPYTLSNPLRMDACTTQVFSGGMNIEVGEGAGGRCCPDCACMLPVS